MTDSWPRFCSSERDSLYSLASSEGMYPPSSPNVSRSSTLPVPHNLRVPRYMRRYTVCAAAAAAPHRPTSPLANSFVPDEYDYDDDAATAATCAHNSPIPSSAWNRRASEPFTVNPGPKVHQCTYTTIPSPSDALSPTDILTRVQSLVADVSQPTQQPPHHLRRQSSNSSLQSQASVSSSSTDCSFHTAVDDNEYIWDESKTLQCLSPHDSPTEDPPPHSWLEHPLSTKHDSSDSSNSGFRSSAFGFASRGGRSSADTVVSPPEDAAGLCLGKEEKIDYDDDDDWPVTYLTTITRRELDEYEKENKSQERWRRFTWGRKQGRKFLADNNNANGPVDSETPMEGGRRKSRKLKKKRPESMYTQEEGKEKTLVSDQPLLPSIVIPIYTDGGHDEFDPLKDLTAYEEPMAEAVPFQADDETTDEVQIGIAISSDIVVSQAEDHPFDMAIQAILNGQDDDWEDMDSADHPGYRYTSGSEAADWIDASILERIRSRTPQEILQGLDVVHEEEEEDLSCEVYVDDVDDVADDEALGDHLEKRESYPCIKNKGKERHASDGEELFHDIEEQQPAEGESEKPVLLSDEPIAEPERQQTPSSPRRRKLSKRRRSRRMLDTDSPPPPLPLASKSKSTIKTEKRDGRPPRRTFPTSKKRPSVPTLRPRRTPRTIMSSVTSHVFRPFALLLGIDGSRRRLSRELRTPNGLLAGRHFSGKHIPRFPSRLDGRRTVNKKVAKYE